MNQHRQENGLCLEMRAKADAVCDAHRQLPPAELEDQLYAHLEDDFPDVSIALIDEVVGSVLKEEHIHG